MNLAGPKYLNVLGHSDASLIHHCTMHSSYILHKLYTLHYSGHLVEAGAAMGHLLS